MGRSFFLKFAVLFLGVQFSAFAYTPTVTSNGTEVRWTGNPKLNLAGNPNNSSGLSGSDYFDAVVRGLQRWKVASGSVLNFDYWQGTDPSIYIPNSEFNGTSSIYFASNSKTSVSPNVLGLTQVWYDSQTGKILETDTILNDRNFYFTTNPRDTSGYGSGDLNYYYGKSAVFVENVITHELGHAFGLSHSGGLQSTMLFMESPEQARLGCDEQVGIRAIYGGPYSSHGGIKGNVVSESGSSVFGAHILAISRRRGTVLATAITDRTGAFLMSSLEAGTYFLLAEPYYAGPQALPSYYSSIDANICPSKTSFSRTVLSDHGVPSPILVNESVTAAPTIQLQCSFDRGAAVYTVQGSTSLSSAPVIYDHSGSGFGLVDRLAQNGKAYYLIKGVSDHLEVHTLSYSLYSPIRTEVTLLDASGNTVPSETISPAYKGDSGFVSFDSVLIADGLKEGDYILKVNSSIVSPEFYPAGAVALDSTPFMILTGSINEGDVTSNLASNTRCRMEENFPAYSSPPGNPPKNENSSQGVGFCGTISGSSRGSPPSPGAIAGWLLPWIVMFISIRISRMRPAMGIPT